MPHLTLNLLGPFQALLDDMPVAFRSDKERALLAFLAVEADRPHRREALTGLLYPEQAQSQAQSNLRKTLFRLRAALGEQDRAGSLLVTPKTVQFNPASPHTLDIQMFRARIEPTRQHKHRRVERCAVCAEHFASANELYRGEFLAGFNRSGSDAFEEWAVITREQSHQLALDALEQLLAFHLQRADWERVIAHARRLLELEPWRETAQRALMTAFAAQGQRAAAFAQYEQCKNILREQFDAEPERETRALYESIRNGSFVAPQAPISNLQSPITPLIGRAREIETLTARLRDPTQRLHTIVGPGGMGKTRLALAVAEQVSLDFQAGAFFVSLAGIDAHTPNANDAIATASADVLGITFSGSIAPARQLQNYLQHKELLLVLDNMEQLLTSAVWIAELLNTAPRLTLLITSRQALNLRAEYVFHLDGLEVPQPHEDINLRANDSVQLFVERAARAAGHFTVTSESLQQASVICRRVEGMPLALELAATWTRTRTLAEIVHGLDENLDSLASTERDLPARHSSLRAVWQGSWDLLQPEEQTILARTTIFRGGFEQNAAKQIINAQQANLDSFIAKSLIKRTETGRYEIHELLRYFSSEKFKTKRKEITKKHCVYYLDFVAQRGKELQKGEPQVILAEIRPEMDNLRFAWQNAVENKWFEFLTPSRVQGIALFYYLTGLFREGLTLVQDALARAQSAKKNFAFTAELELTRATFLERLANYDEAQHALDSLSARTATRELLYAQAQLRMGWICYWTGKLEQGRAVLQETLAWADANNETALEADTLYVTGLIEQSAVNIERAQEFYQRALALYRAASNRYGESSALVNLADIGMDRTRLDDALRYAEAALALAVQIGKRFDQAAAHVILGSIFFVLGNYARAAPHYHESLRLFREMGNGSGESIALRDSAMLALEQGELERARALAQDAARVARQVGSLYREGLAETVLGEALLAVREIEAAQAAYERAMELLERAERGHRALDARAGLVRVAQLAGDSALARARVRQVLTLCDTQNFYDSDNPSTIYLICYQALLTSEPEHAREILARGLGELNARAAQIGDDALRHEFLENNAAARALRAAFTRAPFLPRA